jgi:YD repeat-containing protein
LLRGLVLLLVIQAPVLGQEVAPGEETVTTDESTQQSTNPEIPFPPDYSATDENGVDMVSGRTRFSLTGVSIGAGALLLEHSISSDSNGFNYLNPFVDNFSGGVGRLFEIGTYTSCVTTSPFMAGIGGAFERFCLENGAFESVLRNGSDLADNGNGTYTYTKRDGTRYTIDSAYTNPASDWGRLGMVTEARFPDGRLLTVHHKKITYFSAAKNTNITIRRIQSVTLNNGLQMKYVYAVNSTPTDSTALGWKRATQVVAVNHAFEFCEPNADTCTLGQVWPTATYTWSTDNSVLTVTDSAGRVTRYTHDEFGRVTGVKPPSSASLDKIGYDYCPHASTGFQECATFICGLGAGTCTITPVYDKVRGSIKDGQAWVYQYVGGIGGGNLSVYQSDHPAGRRTEFRSASNSGLITTAIDGLGKTYTFGQDKSNRLIQTQELSGATLSYTYDDRGNVLTIRNGATGDTTAPLLYSAGYPATCANPATCNQPLWTKDANGNQTDFSYDPGHGGVLTVTGPAVNGVRPQTRFAYVQRYAWFKNSAGQFVRAAEPIWLLASESTCRTGAASGSSCALADDEVRTDYAYGPDSGPNNLFLRGVAVTVDGQTLRTCYGNDKYGNRISETQPAAQLASCP